MRNKRFPNYPDDADYNTNAPSYYDDLARKNKLIELLSKRIWEYDERLDNRIADLENVLKDYLLQWDNRIENLDDEVSDIFVEWLNDGTLEQIINHDVLGNKADQSELDKTNEQLTQISYNVKSYGAKGDGITNDTEAFQEVSRLVKQNNGGKIFIPEGVYIVGRQELTGEIGKGNSYRYESVINLDGVKNVTIEGVNAELKWIDGFKYGSFDPITGEPFFPSSFPFWNLDYNAGIGHMIQISNAESVSIKDLELNGNDANAIIGGRFGDLGYQSRAMGILLSRCDRIEIKNVHAHNHLLDGLAINYPNLTKNDAKKPISIDNSIFEYNGRQGFSWTGGIGLTATNSKFNHTGKGAITSAPMAGVDIEPEGSIVKDGLFINCEFADNGYAGVYGSLGDSSSIKFQDCLFFGTTSQAIHINRPKYTFENCTIVGGVASVPNTLDESDRTQFNNCLFTSEKTFKGLEPLKTRLASLSNGNPIVTNSFFISKDESIDQVYSSSKTLFRDCMFLQDGFTGTSYPRGRFEGINKMDILTGEFDLSASVNYGTVTVNGNVIGVTLTPDNEIVSTQPTLSSIKMVGRGVSGNNANLTKITSWFKLPTFGTYAKGDIVFNNEPGSGKPLGWVCVQAGEIGTATPAILKPFALIE